VEVKMYFGTTVLAVLGSAALATAAIAQTPQPAAPATRAVIAATKLPSVTDKPLLFRAVSITVPPGETQNISTVDGVLCQLSGSTEVSIGCETKILGPGEGVFVAAGNSVSLTARSSEPSSSIHFLLAPAGNSSSATAASGTKELYRTP
jgi:hypothetical protein